MIDYPVFEPFLDGWQAKVELWCDRLRQDGLDLSEIERNIGGYVFSARDSEWPDGAVGRMFRRGLLGDRGKEGLPVPAVGGEFIGVQVMGDELVHDEDGDLGVAALCLDEGCGCGVKELVAQQPASTIGLCAEESAREGGDSGRHIRPRIGAAAVVVLTDEAIAERLVRLGFNRDQKSARTPCSEGNEVGIPVLAPEVVKRDNKLRVGFAQDDVRERK